MRKPSWLPVAALAIVALPALAQNLQPQPPQVQPSQAQPLPRDSTPEGFFKPNADIAIGSSLQAAPAPGIQQTQPATPTVETVLAESMARDAAERELDRAQREHDRALAEAARTPPPMIVSPLDGTAPIVSPIGR